MYKNDHVLYGNYDIHPEYFSDYIFSVVEKPIVFNKNMQYEYAARKANMTVTQYKRHRQNYLQALKSRKK